MLWTPFSPFLISGHQTISCIWAWFIYSLSEMPAERFMSSMSLKSASCTPGCHPNSCCSWVKRENEIWLQVITLHIKMLHHTWFWGLTCHLLKLIISSRTNMITNFSKTDWKHADNWYLKKEKKKNFWSHSSEEKEIHRCYCCCYCGFTFISFYQIFYLT